MKKMLVVTLMLLLGTVTWAHGEAILDHQNGQHYEYELSCWGDQTTIYDPQRDTVVQGFRARDCAILYDRGTESFYEIRKTGPHTYMGYDYRTGTTQVFRVLGDGTVSVHSTDSAEPIRFTGDPMGRPALR